MPRLTELADSDIERIAREFAVGEVRSWAPVDAGTINSNYRIDANTGRFFVRVNEGKSESDVRYECDLIAGLAAAGVPTPVPVMAGHRPYLDHAGKWVSLFPWVEGRHLGREEVGPRIAAEVGRALAAMHVAADAVTGLAPRRGIYTFEHMIARAGTIAARPEPELADAQASIAEEIRWQAAQPAIVDDGIIHGDLFRDNALFRGSELSALLDFEQASLGSRVYDLAVCVNAWCFDHAFDPRTVAAMVAAYVAHRGPIDVDLLYRELRRAAWRFTITRITDVYLTGRTSPEKDFRRYLARLDAWRTLGVSGLRRWLSP